MNVCSPQKSRRSCHKPHHHNLSHCLRATNQNVRAPAIQLLPSIVTYHTSNRCLVLLFDRLLLATAGTDSNVHLHVQRPGGTFLPAATLAGHENWIRSLAFCHAGGSDSSGSSNAGGASAAGAVPAYVLLASASQDRWVNLTFLHAHMLPDSRFMASDLLLNVWL